MDLMKSIKSYQSMWSKDPLTALSSTIAWLCVALMVTLVVLREAIAFILLITKPRNGEIVGRIRGAISRGEKVVIWPTSIRQKDINDMVLAGIDVNDVLESNTYSGLEAQVKFTEWKKV